MSSQAKEPPSDSEEFQNFQVQVKASSLPITALAVHQEILFVGEGPFLRIFIHKTKTCIHWSRVLRDQAIHGFTIVKSYDNTSNLLIWGGNQVLSAQVRRTLKDDKDDLFQITYRNISNIIDLPDWILDICTDGTQIVAVTAHNELLSINFQQPLAQVIASGPQSILFSAHAVLIEDQTVLIAGGTAFGEVLIWTCPLISDEKSVTKLHHIFNGHEGSIFGVRISQLLSNDSPSGGKGRVVSSCSDDRTIRVWDISDLSLETTLDEDRNTGFGSVAGSHTSLTLAMGHLSRIWKIHYIYPTSINNTSPFLRILSAGEDGTCQTWDILRKKSDDHPNSVTTYCLQHNRTVGHHNGKNIWSIEVMTEHDTANRYRVFTGGADGAVLTFDDEISSQTFQDKQVQTWELHQEAQSREATLILSGTVPGENVILQGPKKQRTYIKSIPIIEDEGLLVLASDNRGLVRNLQVEASSGAWRQVPAFKEYIGVDQFQMVTATSDGRLVFMVGKSRHDIYCFNVRDETIQNVHHVDSTIAGLLIPSTAFFTEPIEQTQRYCLIITFLGQKGTLFALFQPLQSSTVQFITGFTRQYEDDIGHFATSATIAHMRGSDLLAMGYRTGIMEILETDWSHDTLIESEIAFSTLDKRENSHGQDAVTDLAWLPVQDTHLSDGSKEDLHLASVGRDGHCIISYFNRSLSTLHQIHRITPPFGPNLEGLFYDSSSSELFVYGFRSTRFVLYNLTKLQEIYSIDCGGAHRTWSFQPRIITSNPSEPHHDKRHLGGFLAWMRASKISTANFKAPNHAEIQQGGHGREIKAVAMIQKSRGSSVLNRSTYTIVATGAEDTDIRLFVRLDDASSKCGYAYKCITTLQKHKTGIQQLMWSAEGRYLFSAGSLEELYVWRVEPLALRNHYVGVQFLCECPWRSQEADARITSFDITAVTSKENFDSPFVISAAYSNSIIKTFWFVDPVNENTNDRTKVSPQWEVRASGKYTGASLTHISHLYVQGTLVLLSGATDGHLSFWSSKLQIPKLYQRAQNDPIQDEEQWTVVLQKRIHQSSIKSCETILLNESQCISTYLACTGGDDNALGICLVKLSKPKFVGEEDDRVSGRSEPLVIPNAHAGAITAIRLLERKEVVTQPDQIRYKIVLATVGADQYLRLWNIEVGLEGGPSLWSVTIVAEKYTSVSDPGAMDLRFNETDIDGVLVQRVEGLVCGIGMELWNLDQDSNGVYSCLGLYRQTMPKESLI